jgi:hypothetical protein
MPFIDRNPMRVFLWCHGHYRRAHKGFVKHAASHLRVDATRRQFHDAKGFSRRAGVAAGGG